MTDRPLGTDRQTISDLKNRLVTFNIITLVTYLKILQNFFFFANPPADYLECTEKVLGSEMCLEVS